MCFWSQKVRRKSLNEDTEALDRKTAYGHIKNNSSIKQNKTNKTKNEVQL